MREWNYSTSLHQKSGMGERSLLAAAQVALRPPLITGTSINTSERTTTALDFDQRFPMPFRESVVKHSRAINLDGLCLWPDPSGKPFHHGRALRRGRLGPDAGHARDGALDGQKNRHGQLHARPDQ